MNQDKTHEISVAGMSCERCVVAITEKVSQVDNVTNVSVDLENKKVTVVGGQIARVTDAIVDAGYEVVGLF